MENPKTFLERENKMNLNYVFVSYCSKDKEIVYPYLDDLYLKNINYWYDIELVEGDLWEKIVKEKLLNEHCKGMILCVSENSLISKNVLKEINIAQKNNIKILPIIFSEEKTLKSLRRKIDEFSEMSDEELHNLINLCGYLQEIIYQHYKDTDQTNLITAFKKINVLSEKVIYTRDSFLEEIPHRTEKLNDKIKDYYLLGKYPFVDLNYKDYIEWELVGTEEKNIYLVSRYAIDFIEYSHLFSFLENIQAQYKQLHFIKSVQIISEKILNDFNKNISNNVLTNFADSRRKQLFKVFWVQEGEKVSRFALYNSLKIKIKEKIRHEQLSAGVRLVMIIDNSRRGGEKDAKN